jgi:hypothetical protein
MGLPARERAPWRGRAAVIGAALCAACLSCSAPSDGTVARANTDHGGSSEPGDGTAGKSGGAAGSLRVPPGEDAMNGATDAMPSATRADPEDVVSHEVGDASSVAPGACKGLFCEDFESGKLEASIWNLQANGGQSVEVQKEVVAHGQYAVKFHAVPNVVSYDFIITKSASTALRGHHFGRAYFQVTPKPPQQHTEFLFAGSAGFPKLKYLEVAETGLSWQMTFVSLVAPTGETYGFGGAVPLADWSCLEWEMNDSPDEITVFVGGAEASAFKKIAFNGTSSGLVGGFVDFGFGFYAWHPASYAFDVYYDDIVLDTKRIGCL